MADRINGFIEQMLGMPEDFFNEVTSIANGKPLMSTGMYNALGKISQGTSFNDLSNYYKRQFTKKAISNIKKVANQYSPVSSESAYYDAWQNAAETYLWKQRINNDTSFIESPTGNQPVSGYEEYGKKLLEQKREAEAKKTLAEWDKRDRQQEEARQAELDKVNNKKLGVTSLERNIRHNALYKQFMDHYDKDGTRKIGAVAERDFAEHFDKNLSLKEEYKGQLLDKRWAQTLKKIPQRHIHESQKTAMEKFSKDYNLDVDLSDYKTSALGRIANRIRGNKNISENEAMARIHDAYMKKTDEYVNDLKEQRKSGKITDRQYINRANIGWNRTAAAQERKAANKNLDKLGWKGKAGAAAALLALGGVIGNQFSGGHQSNAQLYNPNPQPQYAN